MISLGIMLPGFVPALAVTAAATSTITNSLCSGVSSATGSSTTSNCGTSQSGLSTNISSFAGQIVNIFSIIVGIKA